MSVLPDLALLIVRVVVGGFYAIRGWQKTCITERRNQLHETLVADGIPFATFNCYWVPANQALFGTMVVCGWHVAFAAAVLGLISLVALTTDAVHQVKEWHPANVVDTCADILYLSETQFGIMCIVLIAHGPGRFILFN